MPLTNLHTSCAKMQGQNHFAKPNQHVLTFLHPIFFSRATYILRMGGAALTTALETCCKKLHAVM
jgi:hypothetical protein